MLTINWAQTDTRTSFILNRGYTGHEHLDMFKLIDMNGRVYDPTVAMFMSPDPFIQSPGNWTNYNRYSYVMNNPMKFTDLSGYFPKEQGGHPGPVFSGYNFSDRNDNWGTGGGTGSGSAFAGMFPQIGKNGRINFLENHSLPGYYSYNWDDGKYYDKHGNEVDYNTVYNEYVIPNSSTDRIYASYNSIGGNRGPILIDGFKLNGKLYEFKTPVKLYFNFIARSGNPQGQGDVYEWGRTGNAIGAGGIAYGALENAVANKYWWMDARGKYNSTKILSKGANGKFIQGVQGYRNGYNSALNAASKFKVAGNIVGGLGLGVTGLQYYNNQITGLEASVDAAFGVISFIGPIGAGIGATYFIGKLACEYFSGNTVFEKPQ